MAKILTKYAQGTPVSVVLDKRIAALVGLLVALVAGCGFTSGDRAVPPEGGVFAPSDAGPCAPATCESLGAECGSAPDGCGGVVECGTCSDSMTCGGSGPNRCGTSPCAPRSCVMLGAQCGYVSDGCSEALNCGSCAFPLVCGLDGANRCGCVRASCADLDATCGTIPDGCGGLLECGSCPAGETCGGGGLNRCGKGVCTPKTCMQLGASCGVLSDGCGSAINCGSCPAPDTCGGGGDPLQCGCTCILAHASTTCSLGNCSIATCHSGWGDCDGDAANGCETSMNSLSHCGGCGISCAPSHGTGACTTGACIVSGCDTGFGDCDGDPVNGCEAALNTAGRCGSCTNQCDPGFVCQGGTCVCQPSNGGVEICDGIDNDCDGQADEDEERVEETPYTLERCCSPPSSYWCCSPEHGGSESGDIGDCCTYTETTTTVVTFSCP